MKSCLSYSAPLWFVRALLDGSKTQTRRACKPQPIRVNGGVPSRALPPSLIGIADPVYGIAYNCPYGKQRDQLWVRETFLDLRGGGINHDDADPYRYRATLGQDLTKLLDLKWKPSIFMPRAASRITLEITSVRVERLQEISRGDCMAEGCPFPNIAKETDPKQWYRDLWESLNGAGSWDLNPWVWVLEFKAVQPQQAAWPKPY